jgi:hypothetical protein
MPIHMHIRKVVPAASQPDFPGFDDDRDSQCEQPGTAERVVADSFRRQLGMEKVVGDCIPQQPGALLQVVVERRTV